MDPERIRNKAAIVRERLKPGQVPHRPGRILAEVPAGRNSRVVISRHDLDIPGACSIRFQVVDSAGLPYSNASFFIRGDLLPGFVETMVDVMEEVGGSPDRQPQGQVSGTAGAGGG